MECAIMRTQKIIAWFKLARPPFHIVGLLPFLLGTWLAWNILGIFHAEIFILGSSAVVFIMMATYFAGEYWDENENTIAYHDHSSRFAGGSRIIQQGILDKNIALFSSICSIVIAAVIGLILVFFYQVGILAILFGFIGMIAGFFYSSKPIRWVGTGVGELWIAFCYGWLPVAIGYYLQTGSFHPLVHLISIPIGLTIFNVILLNEYPDYHADKITGKNNMVVRLGKEKTSYLYIALSIGSWFVAILSLFYGVPYTLLIIYIPIIIISQFIIINMIKKLWMNVNRLETLMGMNLIVNIGTTTSFIIAFLG
jgi:1,4-dihydroxy-2-naphthoate polyprenyltransferase